MSSRVTTDPTAQAMQALEEQLAIPADLEARLLDQVASNFTAQAMQALEEQLAIPADLEARLLGLVSSEAGASRRPENPTKRSADAGELLAALDASALSPTSTPRGPLRRRRWLWLAIPLVALVIPVIVTDETAPGPAEAPDAVMEVPVACPAPTLSVDPLRMVISSPPSVVSDVLPPRSPSIQDGGLQPSNPRRGSALPAFLKPHPPTFKPSPKPDLIAN